MKDEVKQFIVQQFGIEEHTTLNVQDNLIENGIIDSMGMMRLIRFVEKKYGIEVAFEEMLPENFESIQNISDYITTKIKL
ncbi:MAG: acyl carrier protein [Bacteroidota bacterium]